MSVLRHDAEPLQMSAPTRRRVKASTERLLPESHFCSNERAYGVTNLPGNLPCRHQVVAFMEDRGIEVNAQLLQPATAIDVFVRLCLNLLNLYRSSVSRPTVVFPENNH